MLLDVCRVYVVEDRVFKCCDVFVGAVSGTEVVCMEGGYTGRGSGLVLEAGFGLPVDVCGLDR